MGPLSLHRPRASGPWLYAAGRCLAGGWSAYSGHLEKRTSGAYSHCVLSGFLFPLQWLDCSPVYTEARPLGCVNHHDGGGWLLHPVCRALTLPSEAGAFPVPPDGGQLPAGPGGVFPGHLQQQDLPQRCLLCCPGSLPRELVLLTLLPLPQQPFLSPAF